MFTMNRGETHYPAPISSRTTMLRLNPQVFDPILINYHHENIIEILDVIGFNDMIM
jgi:hypothetical protein